MRRWQFLVLIIFLGVFGAGLAVIRFFMPYDLDTELASARAQGIPASYKEIARPPVPTEQDAAPYYEKAWAIQKKRDFTTPEYELLDKLVGRRPVTPAEMATLRRAFKAHADYLNAINSGAARLHRNTVTTEKGNKLASPVYARARETAKILRYESTLMMHDGHPLQAARFVGLGYNVAHQLYEQSGLVPLLVAIDVDTITSDGVRALLLGTPPGSQLTRLVPDPVGANLEVPDLHHALMGEIAFTERYWPRYIDGTDEGITTSYSDRVLRRSVVAANVHWTARMVRAAETPEPHRLEALQRLVNELPSSGSRSLAVEAAWTTADLGPKLENRCRHEAAERRTLYAAALVLEYRARTGRYPEKLEQAVSPIPLDPYDQKPLIYTRTAKGFRVKPNSSPAMVFAYPRP